MKVDTTLVKRLEGLSRLELKEEERSSIIKDMNNILDMVDKLEEVDTENVAPLLYVTEQPNLLRDDEVKYQVDKTKALSVAPDADSDYFKVPTVIPSNK